MTPPIGFIGLGLLGQAMALRLVRSGLNLVVWNREPERSAALVEAGAAVAASPAEVAQRCGVICLCVIDGAAVREVLFGPQGVAAGTPTPRTIVDFSTVPPQQTREIAAEAEKHGLSWIDAPISGGPVAALTGELTIMAGGSATDMEAVAPVFRAAASCCTHVGGVGSGQEMKVINQALVGVTFVMLAEVMALARGLGLPIDSIPACLAGGLADSAALQRVWPRMAGELFEPPTGRAGQLLKDLKTVDTSRQACGLELPLVRSAIAQYAAYVEQRGGADCETISITRLYHPTLFGK